tara:strand:+ start:643 stop:1002 length:360 start_codon:yes stop_codon:yes gene_type:complete
MNSLLQPSKLFVLIVFSTLSFYLKSQYQLFISADTLTSKFCINEVEDLVWENEVNTTVSGNDIQKTIVGNSWNVDATSLNMVYNNGFVQSIADETTTNRMIGLNGNSNFTELESNFHYT